MQDKLEKWLRMKGRKSVYKRSRSAVSLDMDENTKRFQTRLVFKVIGHQFRLMKALFVDIDIA